LSEQSAVYYSFVTLATLGYGDILPRSDIARGIATFEVIGGQLFLAVMVARLIGAFERKESDV
jgi:voltage-gated potassium channel Kch